MLSFCVANPRRTYAVPALIGEPDLQSAAVLPNRNTFDRQAPQPHQRSGPDEYPPNHATTQPIAETHQSGHFDSSG
jgi:hypothetical protein